MPEWMPECKIYGCENEGKVPLKVAIPAMRPGMEPPVEAEVLVCVPCANRVTVTPRRGDFSIAQDDCAGTGDTA